MKKIIWPTWGLNPDGNHSGTVHSVNIWSEATGTSHMHNINLKQILQSHEEGCWRQEQIAEENATNLPFGIRHKK